MSERKENEFMKLAKMFAQSCNKIAELLRVYTSFAQGFITFEEFKSRRRMLLERQSG